MSAATVSGHRKGRSIEAGVRARKSAARLDSRSGRTSWNRFRRSMAPTLSHQGCSTADQGPGLGPSYLQSGLGGTGIAHHGNSRANVNNVLARNIYAAVVAALSAGAVVFAALILLGSAMASGQGDP